MAGLTLAQAEAQLAAYLAAETKILTGQKVEIDGQALTRANLEMVQKGVTLWDARVKNLSAASSGTGRSVNVAPRW